MLFSPFTYVNERKRFIDETAVKKLRKLLPIRKENIGKESGPDGPVQQENFS